jgi:hypothetical protein
MEEKIEAKLEENVADNTVNKELESLKAEVSKMKEELAKKDVEKQTSAKADEKLSDNSKFLILKQEYPKLSDRSIQLLMEQKKRRKFTTTEDGISVATVEEKW